MLRRRLVAAALALALPACTLGVRRAAPTPSPTVAPTVTPSRAGSPAVTPSAAACPASYAAPRPDRPVVALTFDLSDDGRVVTGTEKVTFTPDLPVSELVFRAWPNQPGSAKNGARLEVTSASLPMTVESAGAANGAPGTLVRLALPARVPAGARVSAELAFRLTLPKAAVDRYGHDDNASWWGSGHPLLAWQRGAGWAFDPAVGILGETSVAEAASYAVTVTAPERYTVLASGEGGAPTPLGNGRNRWEFRNPVARDVMVVAGEFDVERHEVRGVPVTVAVDRSLTARATFGPVRANVEASMAEFASRFGPYPYDTLTVVALRAIGGAGVEYPGLFLVGSRRYDVVVTHEMAHMWFYGLVGNNQATEPWLDESFATYGEALVNDVEDDYMDAAEGRAPAVGLPMSHWNRNKDDYGRVVYTRGAGALLLAREAGGPDAFDAAIRCYVNREAYGIATAADLAASLAHLPEAVDVLRAAGALR